MKNFHIRRVRQVDVEGTRALLQAVSAISSPHIVYISNVGVDHTEYFSYQGKYETELLIEQDPAGRVPDIAGPQVLTIEEMTEAYLHMCGRRAIFQSEAFPGDRFDAFRSGIHLASGHAVGTITWDAFLHHLYEGR